VPNQCTPASCSPVGMRLCCAHQQSSDGGPCRTANTVHQLHAYAIAISSLHVHFCAHQELSASDLYDRPSPCSWCLNCRAPPAGRCACYSFNICASAVLTKNCLLEAHITGRSPYSWFLDYRVPPAGRCACYSSNICASAELTKICPFEARTTARSPCS
jgi:hypothetical protein